MEKWARWCLAWAILFSAHAARSGEVRDPHINWVDPKDIAEGTLVTISGSDFRSEGGRAVLLMRAGVPGRPIPIVDWQPTRILALVADCPPGAYQLGLREFPDNPFVRLQESNSVAVTVLPAPPPARAGREAEKDPNERDTTKLGRPYLHVVHPELCMLGEELNLYGVFPSPDRTTYKAVLSPGRRLAIDKVPPQILPAPLEVTRPHARLRLPAQGLPPGEWFLRFELAAVQQSNTKRLIIRTTQPAAWESTSHLEGSGAVPCRVDAAVWRLGAGGQFMDILGRGFGPSEGSRLVSLNTPLQLEQQKQSLRHANDPGAPLYPVPAALGGPGTFWSDTRIRVNLYRGPEKQTGPHFVYIRFPGKNERCSNAVPVVDPQP